MSEKNKIMNLTIENKKSRNVFYVVILFFSLILFGCSSLDKRVKKNKMDFYIGLNSCFEKDNIVIKLNDVELFNKKEVSSDRYSGNTGVFIQYYEDSKQQGLFVVSDNFDKIRKDAFINFKNNLTLEISRNDVVKKYKINLKKGNRILIDGCNDNFNSTSIRYFRGKIFID